MRLAEKAPGLYLTAGTWPELMAQADTVYLLPPDTDDWSVRLQQAASRQKDAFWESSLKVSARETMAEITAAVNRLLAAGGPDADGQALLTGIPAASRLYRRLSDLLELVQTVGTLPGPLRKMENLLASQDVPLRAIRVYAVCDRMDLDRWQMAVLNRLEDDAPPPDADLQTLIETALSPPVTSNPALKTVRRLYSSDVKPPRKIDGVRVIAVRDNLAEAEIVAGLIQTARDEGSRLSDIGLLLPDDPMALMAVETVFNRCGLSLSGFNRPIGKRDLGRETIRQFLLCLRKPAPIMAVAALLTSPLMPWSGADGHALAQAVMDGDFFLKSTRPPAAARKLMDLLDDGAGTPADVHRQLDRFGSLIPGSEAPYDHLLRAHDTLAQLRAALTGMKDLDWEHLLYLAAPESLSAAAPADYWQEGIPVFHEGVLPWCSVRHLFVLGFNDGHYPAGAGASAVFTDTEWEQIAAAGCPVETGDLIRKRQRILFAGQLAAATANLTLLFSRRDAVGQSLEPSASLDFLARSLARQPDNLVWDLDRSEDVRQIKDLSFATAAPPSVPRELIIGDIELNVDLLEAFGRKAGELAPLSPSAAETLMLSPFAWLLGRLGCEPKVWGTDDFDVLKAGTLAHRVFEALFQSGQPLPTEADISARVPKILREWVLQIAPFLRSADWRVERFKFEAEVLRAAHHWKKLLASCNAGVVAAEQWLRGHYGDIPLHGQSDLLVQLPAGDLLVVDYKKSSSGKRRERMRSGFDLQAHLYRIMIRTGDLAGLTSPPAEIGIVYYLMNDTTALSDSPIDSDGSVPGWETLGTDISSQAMQHLDRRLVQIRRGTVRLNTDKDEDWWARNAGMTIYVLDNSPLLRLFMRSEEEPE